MLMAETCTPTLLSTISGSSDDEPDELVDLDIDTFITYASLRKDLDRLIVCPRIMLSEKLMAYSESLR